MFVAAIIIGTVIVFALVLQGVVLSKKDFCCSACSHRFRKKWYQLMFLTHYENEYSVKCPECNKKYTNAVDRE